MTPEEDPFHSIRGRFGGWECWQGISGLLYARTTRRSPVLVVRATDASELAKKIEHANQSRVSEKSAEASNVVALPLPRKPLHELRDGGHSSWYDRP